MTRMARVEWAAARAAYLERVRPWVEERLARACRQRKHPVHDFLFEYYSFRPAHLLRWTPGADVLLQDAHRADLAWSEFITCPEGSYLPAAAFPSQRLDYLRWAVHYLESTLAREPAHTCLGLHEWAMVYRDPAIRHPQIPLRLSREETDRVVETHALRCTHYDAFRFFTAAAVPLNRWELSRGMTADHDQPGCIHANMDLYKFAYKIAPFCPSDLVADAFELARAAREVDMRASPYDLSGYGFSPIRIETVEGRAEYIELQREVSRRGQPIRARLLAVYRQLLSARDQ
jgi:hypothetical protein